jgi:hypothetical protein
MRRRGLREALMLAAQKFSGVVLLEAFDEGAQEVDQACHGVVRELQRQDHDGQIVRFHRVYCFDFFDEREGLRRAARSWASLSR